jgi:two-component system, OmpR family, sensor kinase
MRRLRFFARLPIRVRLTLGFAIAMAVVLAIVGYLVYAGLATAMDESITDDLAGRADLLRSYVLQSDQALNKGDGGGIAEAGTSFAQILSPSGAIVDSTADVAGQALLTPDEAAKASRGTIVLDGVTVTSLAGKSRLLATPVRAGNTDLVIVVGSALEGRAEALGQLLIELLIGGPIALIVASGLAYLLATRALRPVESIRREAEAISASEPGRRLPVPPTDDEIARLSATLNEMLGRLQFSLTRERTFVSNASHELRTPLALLKTEVDLALDRPRSNAELVGALQSIAGETDRLSELADDLLLLARSDEGRLSIRKAPLDVADLLEGLRSRFLRRATEAGRVIRVDVPPGSVVAGDRLRLEQALSNLLENALRHGAGPIDLVATVDGTVTQLHVMDRGPGFSPDLLPQAFERFSHSGASRAQGGTGLGLAIVDIIARAHGGTAHAVDRDGGGADVWLSLPSRTIPEDTTAPTA